MVRASEMLSSASLLLTTITVLFGLWRDDIDAAVGISVPAHLEDAGRERRTVRDAVRYRVWPLLVATSVVLAAFLPVLVAELVRSVDNLSNSGWDASADYDPPSVALGGVVVLLLILEGTLILRLRLLRDVQEKLKLPIPQGNTR
jgi:hypothetical protein